ncbi:MAG: cytochrome bc1 complex diheme cytochrome c subunit [Acidimicrobiales bacterium]
MLVPLLAAVAVGAAAWPGSGAEGRGRPVPARARTTYLADCAACHGAEGSGTSRGPTLKGVGAASVDYMVRTGQMPLSDPGDELERRDPKYPPSRLDDLIAYVTGLTGGGPPIPDVDPEAGDVSAGAQLYRLQCAACHSWAGTGGALEGRQAPSVIPATPVQVAEALRTGPGTMPVFGQAAIDREQLDDVAAYVESLEDPEDRGGSNLGNLGPVAEGAVAIVVGLGGLVLVLHWLGERG